MTDVAANVSSKTKVSRIEASSFQMASRRPLDVD
jgi:hypothetical protein